MKLKEKKKNEPHMKLHEEKYELCNFILAMKLKRKKKLNERTKSMKHHGGNNEL